MAFVKVNKSPRGVNYGNDPVIRMGTHLQGTKTPRSVYMSISLSVLDQLGWPYAPEEGERARCTIAVHEGTHEDAGFFMLVRDPSGYTFGGANSKEEARSALVTNIAVTKLRHYAVNDPVMEHPPENVEFTIDEKEGTILVQLPDWLRYNPASVPEPAPVKVEKKDPHPTMTVVPKEEDVEPLRLNHEERRRIAKKVASRLGR
jgi:hypothetical protein